MLIKGGAGRTIRGLRLEDFNFSLSSTPISTLVNSASSTSVVKDLNVYANTSSTVTTTAMVRVVAPAIGTQYPITLVNKTPSVATLNTDGSLSFVAPGTAVVWAKAKNATVPISVPVTRSTSSSANVFSSYTTGSLGLHATEQVETLLSGRSPSTAWSLYSAETGGSSYTRNTSAWSHSLDLTCVSPWNSVAGQYKAGTLITPQDALIANHFPYGSGTTVQFVDGSNAIHSATVAGSAQVGSSDFYAVHFSTALPSSIAPCKVLPASYAACLPSIGVPTNNGGSGNPYSVNIPVLVLNQYKQAVVADLSGLSSNATDGECYFNQPPESVRSPWFPSNGIISGDSGNPFFLLVNGSPVLVGTLHYGGPASGGGPTTGNLLSQINSTIAGLGSSYTATTVDLSGFSAF